MTGHFRLGPKTPKDQRVDVAGVCHMIRMMKTVSIEEASARLSELADEVEKGAIVVVTRDGHPIFDMVPHRWQGDTLTEQSLIKILPSR